ncbi:MAG: hypothetical protein DCC75_00110 [Proteobacteria bacterium]|nr:MAG: hypothetical protein DCC75_00110 [Pseudomonadota bacterium]
MAGSGMLSRILVVGLALALTVALVSCAGGGTSGTGLARGAIYDSDGAPIPGVSVQNPELGTEAITDEDGLYSLHIPDDQTAVLSLGAPLSQAFEITQIPRDFSVLELSFAYDSVLGTLPLVKNVDGTPGIIIVTPMELPAPVPTASQSAASTSLSAGNSGSSVGSAPPSPILSPSAHPAATPTAAGAPSVTPTRLPPDTDPGDLGDDLSGGPETGGTPPPLMVWTPTPTIDPAIFLPD